MDLFRREKLPIVVFADKSVEMQLYLWLNVNNEKKLNYLKTLLINIEIGFNYDDTIVLSDYNLEDFTLIYSVSSKDRKQFSYGKLKLDTIVDLKTCYYNERKFITVTDKNNPNLGTTYEFMRTMPYAAPINSYSLVNGEKTKSLRREFRKDEYVSSFKMGQYELQFNIKRRPKEISKCTFSLRNNEVPYTLHCEDALEDYLMQLSLPISLPEVYKKLRELSLSDANDFNEVTVTVRKYLDENRKEITDFICAKNGVINKFILSRNGYKIIWLGEDNWTYRRLDFVVNRRKGGATNFTYRFDSPSHITDYISNTDTLEIVMPEVEEAKSLMLKL